ncbi:MAG: hypothetical protein HYT27_01215 [Parcubacteria group bacterium]|nr:hypothetical protein [Parcubacteria group bacterium]
MIKKSFLNALLAEAYIVIIVNVINYGQKLAEHPDTILAPIAMLSLFVLSTAVMGYLFLLTPLELYFEGKKKEAVNLFLLTVVIFGVITGIVLLTLFFRFSF